MSVTSESYQPFILIVKGLISLDIYRSGKCFSRFYLHPTRLLQCFLLLWYQQVRNVKTSIDTKSLCQAREPTILASRGYAFVLEGILVLKPLESQTPSWFSWFQTLDLSLKASPSVWNSLPDVLLANLLRLNYFLLFMSRLHLITFCVCKSIFTSLRGTWNTNWLNYVTF